MGTSADTSGRRATRSAPSTVVALAVSVLSASALPSPAGAYPFFLTRIDGAGDWDSIALGSPGIKHVVPGPSPVPGPDGQPVPGDPALPCLDLVLYGPGIQHIDIIRSTGLECVADLTPAEMNELRFGMRQFAGYVARIQDPATGADIYGVTFHNDLYEGPPEITPGHVSYAMRQIRLTFNEEALGKLVYLPTTDGARERARGWMADPGLTLDFEVYFMDAPATPRFVRGDSNGDGEVDISDPVTVLEALFVDAATPLECRDAADANDDGRLSLTDAVVVLRYLFLAGPPPAPPFPDPGPDPTGDELGDCAGG